MKLIEKTRIGSKVIKKYDIAMMPDQQVFDSSFVAETDKRAINNLSCSLNPATLKRQITKIQNRLFRAATSKKTGRKQNTA